jgi:hypothetical protein
LKGNVSSRERAVVDEIASVDRIETNRLIDRRASERGAIDSIERSRRACAPIAMLLPVHARISFARSLNPTSNVTCTGFWHSCE